MGQRGGVERQVFWQFAGLGHSSTIGRAHLQCASPRWGILVFSIEFEFYFSKMVKSISKSINFQSKRKCIHYWSLFSLLRITIDDFLANFDSLAVCHLPPEANASSSKLWSAQRFRGKWIKNFSAGGRPKFKGIGSHSLLHFLSFERFNHNR